MQIAIDGPASAGKSTIAKRVAKELGLYLLRYWRDVSHRDLHGASKTSCALDDEAAIMQHLRQHARSGLRRVTQNSAS